MDGIVMNSRFNGVLNDKVTRTHTHTVHHSHHSLLTLTPLRSHTHIFALTLPTRTSHIHHTLFCLSRFACQLRHQKQSSTMLLGAACTTILLAKSDAWTHQVRWLDIC